MNHKYKIFGIIFLLIAALIMLKKKNHVNASLTNQFIKPENTGRNHIENADTRLKKKHDCMPYQLFDQEIPLPKHQKIDGNGVLIAKSFNHDIQSSNEKFGHNMNGIIYEDRNKVEVFLGENDEILLYRVNFGAYQTVRNEKEARKQFLLQGVGSIKYGNTYTKKYNIACYYQILYEANQSNNNWPVYYGHHPVKEIEIYPCTFTCDRLYSEGGGEYVTHEGFLVISSVGIDYELDNDYITKLPVEGKIRRDYSLIGVGVNENAKNERERFDKMTANPGVRIWEDRLEVEK